MPFIQLIAKFIFRGVGGFAGTIGQWVLSRILIKIWDYLVSAFKAMQIDREHKAVENAMNELKRNEADAKKRKQIEDTLDRTHDNSF